MIMLALFHVFFILLVWSLFQSMTTDPGQVPVFWVKLVFIKSGIGIPFRGLRKQTKEVLLNVQCV